MNISPKIDMREEVLDYLAEEGFSRAFSIREEGFVDLQARRLYRPERVSIYRIYRFAGEREDGAMDILYTLITDTGVRGYILPTSQDGLGDLLHKHLSKTGGLGTLRGQA